MKIRTRLILSFLAMIMVPTLLLSVAGAAANHVFNPGARGPRGSGGMVSQSFSEALTRLSRILRDTPDSLLTGAGLDQAAEGFPEGISLGVWDEEGLLAAQEGFEPAQSLHRHSPESLVAWDFRLKDGRDVRLEVRWTGSFWTSEWGLTFLVWTLGGLLLLFLTDAGLTFLVSRSVLVPLRQLEKAALKVGEGDLSPSPLPSSGDEFGEVGQSFDMMRKKLQESLEIQEAQEEARRQALAAIAHDLRTPLSALKGYAEGLRDGVAESPEKRKKYLGIILERSAVLEKMVADLGDWVLGNSRETPDTREVVDLKAYLERAAVGWREDFPEMQVVLEVPENTHAAAWADRRLLDRICSNLVENAAAYAGPGPVVYCSLLRDEDRLTVDFRDEGPGMSPEVLGKIFDQFFRGDPARSNRRGSLGLGLPLARDFARSLGGDLTAFSTPGEGSLFRLTLKAAGPA